MAELDYAFLADHAQVEGGRLSAIGASFTHATIRGEEGLFVMSVAGRVRKHIDEPDPVLTIRVRAPQGIFEISADTTLDAGDYSRPYGDRVGILFASGLAFPIVEGLYEVFIDLDGAEVRRLAFDLEFKP